MTHPGVSEVAVFGVPDEKWGETGVAIVVPNPHTEIADEAALYQHLDGRCARYRWPSRFFFWDVTVSYTHLTLPTILRV